MEKTKVFLDTECYPNYFLICFRSGDRVKSYRLREGCEFNTREIGHIMKNYLTIGFNSRHYDLPMIVAALKGADNRNLKLLSNKLIDSKTPWDICRKYQLYYPSSWEHIDLMGPAPALLKLKTYGARMGTRVLQDIPIDHTKQLKGDEFDIIDEYCLNDVNITMELYKELEGDIAIREAIGKVYNLELRSKTKPQIAEAIIRKELDIKYTENQVDTNAIYQYTAPDYIDFREPSLVELYDRLKACRFSCDINGKIIRDINIPRKVMIKDFPVSFGIGGLHSTEKHTITTVEDTGLQSSISSTITTSGKNQFILDLDVTSYYPGVILANSYYPANLGPRFAELYRTFYEDRITAQKNNDKLKAETYKIILNGVFGKYGSVHSPFYAPSMLLHTTLTGQLSLLMLIEHVMNGGFNVISVNTDGIVVKGDRARLPELYAILDNWSNISGLSLKRTFYRTIYHESVNCYIAVLEDGSMKRKGVYECAGIRKNPILTICVDAVIEYLQQRTKIEDTIFRNRYDIKKFLIMRTVKGGGYYKGKYLGKVVRWYYGITGDRIVEGIKGDKVAGSDRAIPLMVIPDTPILDIHFETYVDLGYKMLGRLGVQCAKTV